MEESHLRPKPMVEIGGKPMLWHIMKIYSFYGVKEFIICLGYKGYMIKEYFSHYALHNADITVDIARNTLEFIQPSADDWRVTLVDTGEATQTGGRLKRIGRLLADGEPFCLTYGDGVADIDIDALLAFHKKHGRLATVTAVTPPGRFGALVTAGDAVTSFAEKPLGDGGSINGGFFVLERRVLDYISDDATVWEREPLERLAAEGQLAAYRHDGFWQPMDTLRDRNTLEALWAGNNAKWKLW
jgi:glucose-1-phosphate cytidylyltransferase